jgi:hypothetical protein
MVAGSYRGESVTGRDGRDAQVSEGLTRADEGESVKAPGDAALGGQAIPIAAGWRCGGGGERVHYATGDSKRVGRAWEGPEKRALQKGGRNEVSSLSVHERTRRKCSIRVAVS